MINRLLIRLRTVDMYRTYFKCLVIFTILQSFEILAAMQDYLLPSCNQSIECSIYTGNRSDKIEIEAFDDYPNLRILRVIGSNNLVNSKQLTTNLKTIYTNDYIYFYSYFTHKFIRCKISDVEPTPEIVSSTGHDHNSFAYCIELLLQKPLTPQELNCNYDTVVFKTLMSLNLTEADIKSNHIQIEKLAQITYINLSGKHVYAFNLSPDYFRGVKRINIRNTTISSVSAKSFSNFHNLQIITMSDTLNSTDTNENIAIIDIFASNKIIHTIDTPSAIYWRKNGTSVEKFDRRTKCFSLRDFRNHTTATGCLATKMIDPFDDSEFMAGSYLDMLTKQVQTILMGIGGFNLVFSLFFCLKK